MRNINLSLSLVIVLLIAACDQEPPVVEFNPTIDVDVPEQEVVVVVENDDDDVDEAEQYSPALVEGWMSSNGVQFAEPGNIVEVGTWTFAFNDLSGDSSLDRYVDIVPTGFDFYVESDGDNRFGLPTDTMLAGDIVHYCWFMNQGVDIGGPALNSMSGTYPAFELGMNQTVELTLQCQLYDDAPLGTKISASMRYNVISDVGVYDASVARDDNIGVLPQYYVQIGPDSCGHYDLTSMYYKDFGVSCSLPYLEFGFGGQMNWMQTPTNPLAHLGRLGVQHGEGSGILINRMLGVIHDLPEDTVFDQNVVVEVAMGGVSWNADCVTLADAGVACTVNDIDELIPVGTEVPFTIRFHHLPEVPVGHVFRTSVHYQWTDEATGNGTVNYTSWSVLDSASRQVKTY